MNHSKNTFTFLAARAGLGDVQARNQLEGDLVHIVRRVIHNGLAASSLDRRILAEAKRCESGSNADEDQLIRRIAGNLCSSVIAAQTRQERQPTETIANFSNPDMRRSA